MPRASVIETTLRSISSSLRVGWKTSAPSIRLWRMLRNVRPRLSRCVTVGVPTCASASVAARRSSAEAESAWCSASQRVPATASLGSNVRRSHASNSTRLSLPSGSSVRMTRSTES